MSDHDKVYREKEIQEEESLPFKIGHSGPPGKVSIGEEHPGRGIAQVLRWERAWCFQGTQTLCLERSEPGGESRNEGRR